MRKSVPFWMTFLLIGAVLLAGAPASAAQAKAAKKPATSQTAKPAPPALPPVELPADPGTYAVIYTSMGNIVCRLFPETAPKAVANFVGLATGTKAWTDPRTGKVKRTPLYTGTTFHRVIPDFMIQGGDPAGDGTGSPGYEFEDEVSPDHKFDNPGVLAMANHGKNTNGSQFFITVAAADHLDGNYSVFGQVATGQEVADAISKTPRDDQDKPTTPVKIVRITIRKVPSGPAKAGVK